MCDEAVLAAPKRELPTLYRLRDELHQDIELFVVGETGFELEVDLESFLLELTDAKLLPEPSAASLVQGG